MFCPFFDWVVWDFCFFFFCIEQCQLILEIKPLLVTSLASISSYSIGCLFILLIVSFVMQKLLSLIRSHLFILLLFTLVSASESKEMDPKNIAAIYVRVFCLSFPLGIFILSSLTIGSLIHFEFTSVYVIRECSFILLDRAVQFSQHH